MAINIERAKLTPGWMGDDELTWLAEQAQKHTRILEIGSWCGKSTVAMALNTPGAVYCVDRWYGDIRPEDSDRGATGNLIENFKRYTSGISNIKMYRMESVEAAKFWPKTEQFDMIFIDATHDYENVHADISAWLPHLLPDGLICGHDYHNPCLGTESAFPGLDKVVEELIPNCKVAVNTIWYKPY